MFLQIKEDLSFSVVPANENQSLRFFVLFVRLSDKLLEDVARPWRESPGKSKSSLAKARVCNWLTIVPMDGVTLTLTILKETSSANKTKI